MKYYIILPSFLVCGLLLAMEPDTSKQAQSARPSILFVIKGGAEPLFVSPAHYERPPIRPAALRLSPLRCPIGYQVPPLPPIKCVAVHHTPSGSYSSWCVGCVPSCSCDRCGQACTHFPFGWFLCCCCCMDEEGRAIPIKKCMKCCCERCSDYELVTGEKVCEYLTCGSIALVTLGVLASTGIIS